MALARPQTGLATVHMQRAVTRANPGPRPQSKSKADGRRAPEQERQTSRCDCRAGSGPWR
eukprot:11564097-Alexandrium_andersonii.AAC.1